jgi:hypothetical protein
MQSLGVFIQLLFNLIQRQLIAYPNIHQTLIDGLMATREF